MKISILIPTIDRLRYLRESLEASQRQTYANLEILVSDDGPTRSSSEYVRAVAREDPRVRLLPPNPVRGLYENYNYLISQTSGDAFGILDDDDRWLPEMVEVLSEPLRRRDDVIATFCDHWVVSQSGVRLADASDRNSEWFARAGLESGVVRDALPLSMRGALSTVFALFRSQAFKHESFDLACAGAADLDYAIRAAQKGKLYYINERLGEYRAHDRRTTANHTAWMLTGTIAVFEKHAFEDPPHERLRLDLLQVRYRVKALYVCTRDRAEWWQCIRGYRAAGGRWLDGSIGLSLALVALPRALGESVRGALKRIRRRATVARASDRAQGGYRQLRRTVASIASAPLTRWRYGAFARYLTRARRIYGWTTTEEAAALMQAAWDLPAHATVVEVGSFLGKSAVVLGGARRLRGSGRVHCIDPFDASGDDFSVTYYRAIAGQSTESLRERFDRHIRAAGLQDWIVVHQGTAEDVGAEWTLPIDLLHLDGDQSPSGARRAFETFAPFLKPGAIVAVHNSSDREYHEGHDGSRRLVVEVVCPPRFRRIASAGSTTIARFEGPNP
jgi:MMP 1-O-methyltransferase